MRKPYLVAWEIDIWAESPLEAAQEALRIQRDVNSDALVFDVHDGEAQRSTRVDLADNSETPL